MCGRFVRVPGNAEIMAAFAVTNDRSFGVWKPSYNVAPSHSIPIVVGSDERSLDDSIWGFTATWKGAGGLVINARVETVFDKPTFRRFTSKGRCVIPMSGYYEWLTNEETKSRLATGKGKVPFFVTALDGSPLRTDGMLAAAGLVSGEHGERRCVMLTRPANDSVVHVHDRMPLLLDRKALGLWLADEPRPDMESIMVASESPLVASRANRDVNSVRHDSPHLLEAEPPDTLF